MKRIYKEKLARIGITTESYVVEAPAFDWEKGTVCDGLMPESARARGISTASIWGLALRREERGVSYDIAVIEQTPRSHDHSQDGRYHVRAKRSRTCMERALSKSSHKTQREAIAAVLQDFYSLTDEIVRNYYGEKYHGRS